MPPFLELKVRVYISSSSVQYCTAVCLLRSIRFPFGFPTVKRAARHLLSSPLRLIISLGIWAIYQIGSTRSIPFPIFSASQINNQLGDGQLSIIFSRSILSSPPVQLALHTLDAEAAAFGGRVPTAVAARTRCTAYACPVRWAPRTRRSAKAGARAATTTYASSFFCIFNVQFTRMPHEFEN